MPLDLSSLMEGGTGYGAGVPSLFGKTGFGPSDEQQSFWELPLWGKALDLLSRTNYMSASFAHSLLTGQGNPLYEALRGLMGQRRTTYSDVLAASGFEPGLTRSALGFAGDVLLDPLTYVTFGAGTGEKAAVGGVSKVLTEGGSMLRKAGLAEETAKSAGALGEILKPTEGAADLLKAAREAIPAAGMGGSMVTPEAAAQLAKPELTKYLEPYGLQRLAGESPEFLSKAVGELQTSRNLAAAAKGEDIGGAMGELMKTRGISPSDIVSPSAVRFAGLPVVSGETLAKPFRAIAAKFGQYATQPGALGDVLRAGQEVVSKTGGLLKSLFSTSTGNPELDAKFTAARDWMDADSAPFMAQVKAHAKGTLEALGKDRPAYDRALRTIGKYLDGVYDIQEGTAAPEAKRAMMQNLSNVLMERLNEAKQSVAEGVQLRKEPGILTAEYRKDLKRLEGSRAIIEELAQKGEKIEGKKAEAQQGLAQVEPEVAQKMGLEPEKRAAETATMARKMAREANRAAAEAHEQTYGQALGEIKAAGGVRRPPEVAIADFEAAVPKKYRALEAKPGRAAKNLAGMALDELGWKLGDFDTNETLEWLQKATAGPEKKKMVDFLEEAKGAAGEKVFGEKVAAKKAALGKALDALSEQSKLLQERGRKSLESAAVHAGLAVPEGTAGARAFKPGGRPIVGQLSSLDILKGLNDKIAQAKSDLEKSFKVTRATIDPALLERVKDIQAQLEGVTKALAEPVEAVHPRVVEEVKWMRDEFDKMWQLESQKLAVPPEYRQDYMPHQLKDRWTQALVETFRKKGGYKDVLRPEFVQSLNAAQRRTFEGTVDSATIYDLMGSRAFDPSKVQAEFVKRGIHMTADDKLVFETDPYVLLAKRGLKSIRALNAADLARSIIEDPLFTKAKVSLNDPSLIRATLAQHPEHALYVDTRSYIQHMRSPAEVEAMRAGAEKQLQGSLLQEIKEALLPEIAKSPEKSGMQAYILPREAAEHLSKAFAYQFDDKRISEFLRLWDKATGWWKAFATVPRPGFHIRNAVNNIWQGFLAGVRDPGVYFKAAMLEKNPEAVGQIGRWSGPEVAKLAQHYGIRFGGMIHGDIAEMIERELRPTRNPFSTAGPIVRYGARLGELQENVARLGTFIDLLHKGHDPASAAMSVKKYMFDYKDLTKAERVLFKRIIPFYTWTKNSIPLAVETMLTQPGKVSALGKIQTAGQKNVEGALDQKYVSEFIRDGMGVPIRKTPDGKTEYFLLHGWIPTLDLARFGVDDLLSSLHPAIKSSIELATNKSLFTGRPIERFSGELTKFLGVPMRGQEANLLRNITVLQEVDRMLFQGDVTTLGPWMGEAGFRTYAQDKMVQMRRYSNDLTHQIGEMKNAITLGTQKYGSDSVVVRQAERHLQQLLEERGQTLEDLRQVEEGSPKSKSHPQGLLGELQGRRKTG